MKNLTKIAVVLVFGIILFSGCIENTGSAVIKKKPLVLKDSLETQTSENSIKAQKPLEENPKPKTISFLDEIKAKLIPTGKPDYGEGSLFFAAQKNSLNNMVEYNNEIVLSKEEDERFKKIADLTFCEFCCGPLAIDKCPCRHAQGYRGIVKYLIKNFPDYSDKKIVEEQEKWKATFFQKGTIYKYLKEQKELGKVSEEEINGIEEMIGIC